MRQHIEVTKPVDDSRLLPVLPRAGSGGSKAMYRNDAEKILNATPKVCGTMRTRSLFYLRHLLLDIPSVSDPREGL